VNSLRDDSGPNLLVNLAATGLVVVAALAIIAVVLLILKSRSK
jgi:hypothetical protein